MQVELAGTVKSSSQGWAKCQQLLRDGWAPCSVNHFFMLIVLPTPSLPPTSRWRKAAAEVRLQQLGITWQPQVCFNTYMAVRCCNGTEKAQMARQLCLLCLFFNDFFTFPNWKSEKLPYCTCCLTFEMRWVAIGILLHLPDACAQRRWLKDKRYSRAGVPAAPIPTPVITWKVRTSKFRQPSIWPGQFFQVSSVSSKTVIPTWPTVKNPKLEVRANQPCYVY